MSMNYYVGYDGKGPYEGLSGATGPYMVYFNKKDAEKKSDKAKKLPPEENYLRKMKFAHNVHEHGVLQTTVRRGTQWADLVPGQEIALVPPGDDIHIVALVTLVGKCRLKDIPLWVMQSEHDQGCRDFEGLQKELCRVYNDTIDLDEVVTFVQYTL